MNQPVVLFLNLGGGEIAVIMLVILLFFGADKVPELARGLGKGIRQFKDAMNGLEDEVKKATDNVQREVQKTLNGAEPAKEVKSTVVEPPKAITHEPVQGTVDRGEEKKVE